MVRAILVCALVGLFVAPVARAQGPARSEGWVVIPVDEYRALRLRAFPPDGPLEPPPVDATLTRVEYDLRGSGDSIAGEARLTIDVLKEGWVRVDVPAGLLVRSARVDGRPIALIDKPRPHVLLSKPGRAVLSLDVVVPSGATMLSVEVAGETARPVMGSDGTRVPLLRAGFRPDGPYTVSFIYLHNGEAFAKRGDARMILPAMDVPVTVLEWELFLPDRFSAKPAGGNVIPAHMVRGASAYGHVDSAGAGRVSGPHAPSVAARAGQIVGRVTDMSGGVIPGARVTVRGPSGAEQSVVSNRNGLYTLNNVPSGTVRVRAELEGFQAVEQSFLFAERPQQVDFWLPVAGLVEAVTVQAESAQLRTRDEVQVRIQAPSQNVMNLQRRVAGVLPVRMDVQRTGTSHRFVRPLVLEEETNVTFKYKRR